MCTYNFQLFSCASFSFAMVWVFRFSEKMTNLVEVVEDNASMSSIGYFENHVK